MTQQNTHNWLFALLVLVGLSACACSSSGTIRSDKLLLISFDGYRYDYPDKAETPHFDSLSAGGVRAEGLIPVFPSKTFPNHYAMATGL